MPSRPLIIVAWGISDSGKDTFYNIYSKHNPNTVNIKFSQPCKDILETWLSLPKGCFNDKQFRKQKVLNPVTGDYEEFTYDDIIVNSFKAWELLYPGGYLTVDYVARGIRDAIYDGKTVVLTDVRRKAEVNLLSKIKYCPIVLAHIVGRGIQKYSDRELTLDDFKFIEDRLSIINTPEVSIVDLEQKIIKYSQYIETKYANS